MASGNAIGFSIKKQKKQKRMKEQTDFLKTYPAQQ